MDAPFPTFGETNTLTQSALFSVAIEREIRKKVQWLTSSMERRFTERDVDTTRRETNHRNVFNRVPVHLSLHRSNSWLPHVS